MTLPELQAEIDRRKGQGQTPRSTTASRWSGTRSSRSPPPAWCSACSASASPWAARRRRAPPPSPSRSRSSSSTTSSSGSASRRGTPALLSPFLAMWGANIVLGVAAGALLFLNHREAAFDPLDVRHYIALVPRVRRRKGAAGPRRRPARTAPDRARGARPPTLPALPHPPRPLHHPALPRLPRPHPRRLRLHLPPRGLHGAVRRHPAEQRQGQGGPPLLRLLHLPGALHRVPGGGARDGARDPRRPFPPQRDHGHEGGRDQRLPGGRSGARAGCRDERDAAGHAGGRPPRHEPRGGDGLQRDQGPAPAVLGPPRPPLDPRERRPLLQLRLPHGVHGDDAAAGYSALAGRAAAVLALRTQRLRGRPRELGPPRADVRRPRRVRRRLLELRAREGLAARVPAHGNVPDLRVGARARARGRARGRARAARRTSSARPAPRTRWASRISASRWRRSRRAASTWPSSRWSCTGSSPSRALASS